MLLLPLLTLLHPLLPTLLLLQLPLVPLLLTLQLLPAPPLLLLAPLLLMLLTQLLTLLLTLLKLLPLLLLPSNHWLLKKSRPLGRLFYYLNHLKFRMKIESASHYISIQSKPSSWHAIVTSTNSLWRAPHSAAYANSGKLLRALRCAPTTLRKRD